MKIHCLVYIAIFILVGNIKLIHIFFYDDSGGASCDQG